MVGTLEDTAAERLLDQMGIAKKVYGNQVEPYIDLELGRLDAVLLDLPIATYYAQPEPEAEVRGPGHRPGLLCHRLSQGPGGAGRRVRRRAWLAWPSRASSAASTRNGTSGTSTRSGCSAARASATSSASRAGSGPSAGTSRCCCKGPWSRCELTFISMLLAMALGLPIALLRLYGPAPLRLGAMVYVEFFRGIPVLLLLVLPLLRAAGDRRALRPAAWA